jgi:hypothetical protein
VRPSQPTVHNKVTVADCANNVSVIYDLANPPSPSPLGTVHFSESGNVPGYNPCAEVIPTVPVTWSSIKAAY